MAFNRDRTIKLAEKYVRAGKILEAVGEYKKLADDNPRDMNVINKLGDLLARAGKNQEAQRYFLRIAEYYAKDGFYLKAIAMYKKINKTDPSNLDCLQRLAGLYQQQGLLSEAKALYLQVADLMVRKHQFQPAAEVLPKVLEIEPDNLKVRLTLAELFSRTGRPSEAGREYAHTARILVGQDMMLEAIKVIRKGLRAAPGNAEVVALLLSVVRAGGKPSLDLVAAAEEIAAAGGEKPLPLALLAEVYRRSGEESKAEEVLGKLQAICGSPEEALPEMAEIMARSLVSKGRSDEAYEWLARAVDGFVRSSRQNEAAATLDEFLAACPEHRAALESRAAVAAGVEDTGAEVAALERLAPLLNNASETERTQEVVQRLLVLEPDNERFREMLAGLEQPGGPPADPAPVAGDNVSKVAEEGAAAGEGVLGEPIGASQDDLYGPDSKIQELQAEGDGEPIDEEFVSEHLTEAEVFVKYGLLEKAKLQLQEILSKYPRHVPARLKLKEVFVGEGNTRKAVEECLALVEIRRADASEEELRDLINEAIRLDPGNARVRTIAARIGAGALPAPESAEDSPGVAAETADGVAGADEEQSDLEIEIELPDDDAGATAAPGVAASAGFSGTHSPALQERVEEETPDDLPSIAPASGEEDLLDIDLEGLDLPSVPRGGRAAAAASDPDAEKLGEVDFYIDQGLMEEAGQIVAQLRKQFPGSREVQARAALLESDPSESAPSAAASSAPAVGDTTGDVDLEVEMALAGRNREPEPPKKSATKSPAKPRPVFKVETPDPASEGDFFDLAGELDQSLAEAQAEIDAKEQDALEGPGHSLDDIFKAFKKGVEQQVGSEDYDTHYNLGIAYREMGLFDEAIGEFQFAAKDPSRVVECCGILGLCFRDKGMPDQALQWYRKGLDMPDLGEREAVGLRYDIAEVYYGRGELNNALKMYQEVFGVDSSYRDVARKIAEVKSRLG